MAPAWGEQRPQIPCTLYITTSHTSRNALTVLKRKPGTNDVGTNECSKDMAQGHVATVPIEHYDRKVRKNARKFAPPPSFLSH